MISALTFSGLSARAASVAATLESTPPESPSTTRSKPTLRTSLRTKPIRMSRTRAPLICSAGKTSLEGLAGALMPDAAELVDRELDLLVAQQRALQPFAADG